MTQAVIMVRSNINVKGDIRHTLKLLRLNRVNHCVILPDNEYSKGMLQKVKDYVTWGEVKPEVLARMLLMKGRLEGNKPITTAYIKSNTDFGTPLEFAKAVVGGQSKLADVRGIKPVIRLHPPIKGYEGIKRAYTVGGALGYRGEAINDLILRMLGPEDMKQQASVKAKAPPAKKTAPKTKPVAKKPVPKKAADKADEKPESKPVKKPAKKAENERKGDAQ